MAHHFPQLSQSLVERASAFTSKGSITLEAAISTCFFFFAALCLVGLMEIMALQTTVRGALYAVGKEMVEEAYLNPNILASRMEKEIAEIIGKERLENSMIVGGSSGIDCSRSKTYGNTTIMELSASYQMELPILMFRIPIISHEETIRIKGWTGDEGQGITGDQNEMVYVTDSGIVYHKDISCTYLELSIRAVSKESVSELRNQSGGVYKECTLCKKYTNMQGNVYLTNYGDRYHVSLECSGLKRNIYAVPLKDVYGLGGCAKCVK